MASLILSFVVTKILAGYIFADSNCSIFSPEYGSKEYISSISSSQNIILIAMSWYAKKTSTVSPFTLKLPLLKSISERKYRESTK